MSFGYEIELKNLNTGETQYIAGSESTSGPLNVTESNGVLSVTTDGTYDFSGIKAAVWKDELDYSEPAGQAPTGNYADNRDVVLDDQVTLGNRPRSWKGTVKGKLDPLVNRTESMYATWWQQFSCDLEDPAFFTTNNRSDKFARVWDDSNGNGTRVSWTKMHLTYSDANDTDWEGMNFVPNTWTRMELWVTPTTIKALQDGVVAHDISDQVDQDLTKDLFWAQVGYDMSQTVHAIQSFNWWLSDLYQLDTPARVEISDSPTWNNGQIKRYVQDVISADATTIQANLNLSDLTGSTYVYVVDENNNVMNENGVSVGA